MVTAVWDGVCILVSINKAAQECLDTKGCFWLLIKYLMSSFLPFLKEKNRKRVQLLKVSKRKKRKENCEASHSCESLELRGVISRSLEAARLAARRGGGDWHHRWGGQPEPPPASRAASPRVLGLSLGMDIVTPHNNIYSPGLRGWILVFHAILVFISVFIILRFMRF